MLFMGGGGRGVPGGSPEATSAAHPLGVGFRALDSGLLWCVDHPFFITSLPFLVPAVFVLFFIFVFFMVKWCAVVLVSMN